MSDNPVIKSEQHNSVQLRGVSHFIDSIAVTQLPTQLQNRRNIKSLTVSSILYIRNSQNKMSSENVILDCEDVQSLLIKYGTELKEMRSSLSDPVDCIIDDVLCYRFLKGFKFSVSKASIQLEKMNKWRRENKMTDLRSVAEHQQQSEFPHYSTIVKYYPHNIGHSHDKKGQPLSIERFGLTNPHHLCKNLTLEELMEYHYSHMENKAALAARLTRQTGKVIRLVKIVDLTGLGRKHLSKRGLEYFKHALQISQEYYPEHLGTMCVGSLS